MKRPSILIAAAAIALLAGCAGMRIPGVYRIDIQQGNVITQEQLAALERGMEKRKVRFILGTPLVADTFNQERWDYYYSLDRRGDERVQRIISVYFDADRLVRIGGDVEPALGPIKVDARKDELVAVPEGYRDQGLLASLAPDFLTGKPKRRVEPEQAPVPGRETVPLAAGQPVAVAISTEDERFLRELMADFGRGPQPIRAGGVTAAGDATVSDQDQARDEQAQEEGVLSRWARRLGPPPDISSPRD
jgi:outer membrane protein assembly factor BamE